MARRFARITRCTLASSAPAGSATRMRAPPPASPASASRRCTAATPLSGSGSPADPNAGGYGDFDRFLAPRPMDAVAIGSPSGLHAEQGIAAARQGLHVIVE